MKRRLAILALVLGTAPPAAADTIEQRLAAELQAQGYKIVEANRTWLGRLRVVAESDEIRREIVVDPGTGEILRDYSVGLPTPEQQEPAQPKPPASRSLTPVDGGEEGAGPAPSPPAEEPETDGDAGSGEPSTEPEAEAPDDDPVIDIPLLPAPLIPNVIE
jgi:hypothetical protein